MAKVAFTGSQDYRVLIDPKYIVSIHETSYKDGTLIVTVSEKITVKHSFDEVNELLNIEKPLKRVVFLCPISTVLYFPNLYQINNDTL